MGDEGTTPELEFEDLCEESEVVTKELIEEVDIGFRVMRSLFRIGEFCMGCPLTPLLPSPLYMCR